MQLDMSKHMMPGSFMPHLYQDLPPIGNKANRSTDGNPSAHPGPHSSADLHISTSMIPSFGSKLGLLLPDPAPDVAPNPEKLLSTAANTQFGVAQTSMRYSHRLKINTMNQTINKPFNSFLFILLLLS